MENNQSKIENRKSKIDWLILSLLIFIPRLLNLDVFLTADEPLFLEQAREFAAGLAGGDFSRTLGIGYPGVTVAWWSAPVVGLVPLTNSTTELGAYTAGRLATALATGLLMLLLYALARVLVGRWPALLGVGLLALDPYSLAYSRLLHIAMPLALFMSLAGLAWLLWLRDAHRRWLLVAGLLAGLALLTKSTALLLGPMLSLSLLGWAVTTAQWRHWGWWRPKIGGLVVIALLAIVVFFALWPAMWVAPGQALRLTFSKLFTDQEAGTGNLGLFWFGRFVEDPGPAFYPVAFLLKATPWLLVGLCLSLYQVIRYCVLRIPFISRPTHAAHNTQHATRNTQPCPERSRRDATRNTQHILPITLSLWLFTLTYLIFMTIASKKSVRYMLPAFPVFYLLAGLAFYQISDSAIQRFSEWRSKIHFYPSAPLPVPVRVLPLLLFLPLALFTFFYHPYYFTYYNPLLLGWRWAPHTLLVGWGEGLDEAARYLNRRPDRTTVSAWYEWLFPIFYHGQVEPVVPQENLITADHTVLYLNQVQRDIPGPNIVHYFRTRRRPEHTVRLAGIDYAWVYPGPIAGFRSDPLPQYPLGGQFGDEARLLGYDLHPPPRSGQPLVVTLYWRALTTPAGDRFVYLRLVDEQGHVWARADSPPVMGLWPTTRWQPGMLVEDAYELPIPPGTPPGTYRLEVGLYDPASGQPLLASGQPVGQGGGLLLGQVQVEWQSLSNAPDLPQQTDTRLAPNARLIGYDAPPAVATSGDLLPIRLAWRESKTLFSFLAWPNNFVMFEWRLSAGPVNDQPLSQQLDELPWPIEAWGRRATLLSYHAVIVPPSLATGQYELVVMLHDSSVPAGQAFSLGRVEVTAPAHQFELPAKALVPAGPAGLAQHITLAGYQLDPSDRSLELHLYWQTEAPVTTRYKVFAQLLTADNALVAQVDNFPAAGQRPTTGWLPGEIITDPHSLPLSPDVPAGVYRLITGLYNPLTGERLPVVDETGETVADAIFVTEVTLP